MLAIRGKEWGLTMAAIIEAVQGDITKQDVDAIVNAANTSCSAAAAWTARSTARPGRELLPRCRNLGGCPTGDAKITPRVTLPANHVIHTVGPVWHGGSARRGRNCCAAATAIARARRRPRAPRVAFPSISTGVYGFPIDRAARIAIDTVRGHVVSPAATPLELVRFVCFSAGDLAVYGELLVAA